MEWASLDKNRLDKMLLFVRIVVAAFLEMLNGGGWDLDELRGFGAIVLDEQGIFNNRSLGLAYQFLQVFLEEFRETREGLVKNKEFVELSPQAYLQLIAPFLRLAVTLDNKQVFNTLDLYVLRRVGDLPGVPTHGVVRAMGRLAESQFVRPAVRKALKQCVNGCGQMPGDSELDVVVDAAIRSIEAAVGGAQAPAARSIQEDVDMSEDAVIMQVDNGGEASAPVRTPNRKGKKGVAVRGNGVGTGDVAVAMAPELVDVSADVDGKERGGSNDVVGGEDDGFITLSEAFASRKGNSIMGRHLRVIATLSAMRRYILATGMDPHHIIDKLNTPRMRRQMAMLALYNIRRLNPDRRFKCARKLHRIMTITETAQNLPSRRRSVDIAKALHNIKHATPGESIVRKRNRRASETKHVVFNLKNNQIATIPKKTRSTLTMPSWF
ncbi:nucleolar protein Nop52, putative [Babesia caballi]|uniref:Nucleolar protein Nop52, putative n=1 Tax=Babesia caballi TaxID=5871 RepID=A0AAV4LMH9_BABCB|nr:nucleolar protein Nop52, putative [Babesia caballi]